MCTSCIVTGRVQGVGFRWATRTRARALGLRGRVRNLPDGRVEVVLCGSEKHKAAMLDWLKIGPALASVKSLECTVMDAAHYVDFDIA